MRIASLQLEVDDARSKLGRLELVDTLLSTVAKSQQHPDIVMLPELWGCGFFDYDNYTADSEPLMGETFALLSDEAKRLQSYILGGSILEADGDNIYNTTLLINREGELEGSYRKMHLFGFESREQQLLLPGEFPVVIPTSLGNLGLCTCYDLRFPEQFRAMVDMDAELFLVPAAWPEPRIAHWQLFNQVRALENQCWLVSCNCSGVQKGSRYGGNSMVVSPMGEVCTALGLETDILYFDIDITLVRKARESFPALADRKPIPLL